MTETLSDMERTVLANSNQLNADDLVSGPRVLLVKSVEVKPADKKQPITIHYAGDDGHPYKPNLSMRRILITLWGKEKEAYIGRSIVVFRDPTVRFGSDTVGGIVISHLSHIERREEVALTISRGKKKTYIIEPYKPESKPAQLDQLPAEWSSWSNEERGYNRASLGTAALVAWWRTLTAEERTALESKKDSEWKPLAAGKDGAKSK